MGGDKRMVLTVPAPTPTMRGLTVRNSGNSISNLVIVEADGRPLLVDKSAISTALVATLDDGRVLVVDDGDSGDYDVKAFVGHDGTGYHFVERGERFYWVWSEGEGSTAADDEVCGPFTSLIEAMESAIADWEESGDNSIKFGRLMRVEPRRSPSQGEQVGEGDRRLRRRQSAYSKVTASATPESVTACVM